MMSRALSRCAALLNVRNDTLALSLVEVTAELRADVRHAARNLVLAQSARPGIQQLMGQTRHAGFFRRVKAAARLQCHSHIQHREIVIFHEQHLRAAGTLPMLDVWCGAGQG